MTGAPGAPGRRRNRRATSSGSSPARAEPDGPVLPDRAAEDTDEAWGRWREDGPSDDERILREKPPHWS